MQGDSEEGPIGRPRDARADRAILPATLELMAEQRRPRPPHGRRGRPRRASGRATIYRRYRSKDELVTAAVAALVSEITVPDTGSTRGRPARADAGGGRGLQRVGAGRGDAEPGRGDEPRRPSSRASSARGS